VLLRLSSLATRWRRGHGGDAREIGDAGQVVGVADGTGFSEHAFLYSNGQTTDLNTQVPTNSGWTLSAAVSMNDAGQIAGWGTTDTAVHAYLLTDDTRAHSSNRELQFAIRNSEQPLDNNAGGGSCGTGSAACSAFNDFIAEIRAQ
jgi:probable HAF family extracellular repeat protein